MRCKAVVAPQCEHCKQRPTQQRAGDGSQNAHLFFGGYLVTSLLLAHAVAAWLRTSRGLDPGPILWKMILSGFGVARLVFVWRHHDLYFSNPISIIDLRDGRFYDLAGFATAFVIGVELTRRSTALRRPLAAATLVGCAIFFGGTLLNQALMLVGTPVPPVQVRRLDGSTVSLDNLVQG